MIGGADANADLHRGGIDEPLGYGLYRLLHHLGVIEAPQHVTPVTVQPREWATGQQILYGMNGLTVAPGAELAAIAQPHD
ncbi:hypothetical protein ABZ078_32710 [Streptomyces sp. NPDC006385]|uniref:hypothetical protein n=1 Tax=Streptomyces sp. NPDC006385 TaxID=3156761 RepID=UPI0033B4572D